MTSQVEPPPSAALLARTHDFARLNHRLAQQLQGRRVAFRVRIESAEGECDGLAAFGCAGPSAEVRSVVFAPAALDEEDLEAGQVVTVEAELAILYRGAWVAPDGARVPGFTEYRLVGARLAARRAAAGEGRHEAGTLRSWRLP